MALARSGHVERLPSGSLRVSVLAGRDPLTGRQVWHRKTVRTEVEAQVALGRLLEDAVAGKRPDSRVTLGELLDRYLDVADLDLSTGAPMRDTSGGRSCPPWARQNCGRSAGRCWTTSTRGCGAAGTSPAPDGPSSSTPRSRCRRWRRAAGRPGSRSPRRSARRSGPGSSLRARNSCRRTRWPHDTACGWQRRGMRWKPWPRKS